MAYHHPITHNKNQLNPIYPFKFLIPQITHTKIQKKTRMANQKHIDLFALLDSNQNGTIQNHDLTTYINLFNDLGQITDSDLTSILSTLKIPLDTPKTPKTPNPRNPTPNPNALNYDQFTSFLTSDLSNEARMLYC